MHAMSRDHIICVGGPVCYCVNAGMCRSVVDLEFVRAADHGER